MAGRRSERFLTTVLCTDIVGSTEMAAELGDQGWREPVQEHNRLVRAAGRNRPAASGQAGDDGFGLLPVRTLDLVDDVAPAQDVDRLVVGCQVDGRHDLAAARSDSGADSAAVITEGHRSSRVSSWNTRSISQPSPASGH